jgi:16S rRNA (guanine966-N2)-methyltransferase
MQRKSLIKTAQKNIHNNIRNKRLHQIRIIAGRWKRTPLTVIVADGLRPTPDRVRETVFNWLNYLIDGHWEGVRCLDLFAGSGALGFEAASRGAGEVIMVESNPAANHELQAMCTKLDAAAVAVQQADALATLHNFIKRQSACRFDVIFLDPPFHQGWLAKLMPLCRQVLLPNGFIYVETEQALMSHIDNGSQRRSENMPTWLEGWNVVRADHAGMVFYHLLQPDCNAP